MKPGWLLYISGLYSQIHGIRSDMQIQSENGVVLGSVFLSEPPEEFKNKTDPDSTLQTIGSRSDTKKSPDPDETRY